MVELQHREIGPAAVDASVREPLADELEPDSPAHAQRRLAADAPRPTSRQGANAMAAGADHLALGDLGPHARRLAPSHKNCATSPSLPEM